MLTGGNANGCAQFTTVMDAIRVPRPGRGRPRTRPDHVIGDKGYSSKAIRIRLRHRNTRHTTPERADQVRNRARKGSCGGRPPTFDKEVYKHRKVVERCFNRLKERFVPTGLFDISGGRATSRGHACVTIGSCVGPYSAAACGIARRGKEGRGEWTVSEQRGC